MFTNNQDFYPTPNKLISKMISGLDFCFIHSVLEPSAGKGDLIESLKNKKLDIDCIEHDQNLKAVLKEKGYRVIYDDFLTFSTLKEYDLILMNPPFSNGSKHLLKAIELQERNGGAIVCLLNSETLKNPFSNERKSLVRKLEELEAKIEYLEEEFVEAERTTNVEVALIKISIPQVKRDSKIYSEMKKTVEMKEAEEYTQTGIVENDFIKTIVKQYELELEAGIALIHEFYAMRPLILSYFPTEEDKYSSCILNLTLSSDRQNNIVSVNDFIRQVRKKYWSALFTNQKFVGKLTANLQREYYNRVEELKEFDFSEYNIREIRLDMNKNMVKGIEETIVAMFDELSHKYYYYDETGKNIHYFNGWKTNKSWIINKKVIIPLSGYRDLEYSWGGFQPTYRDTVAKIKDIEKCLDYLDGNITVNVDLEAKLKEAEESEQTKNIDLKYFKVTFFKKGTCHIIFKNEELLKKFNIYAARNKHWLPPSYGKAEYKEMNKEEQEVIDQFEGKDAYERVYVNSKYYLMDDVKMLEMN